MSAACPARPSPKLLAGNSSVTFRISPAFEPGSSLSSWGPNSPEPTK